MSSNTVYLEKLEDLSRVEFLKKFNDNINNDIDNYQDLIDQQAILDDFNEDEDPIKYAYNTQLPKIT